MQTVKECGKCAAGMGDIKKTRGQRDMRAGGTPEGLWQVSGLPNSVAGAGEFGFRQATFERVGGHQEKGQLEAEKVGRMETES